MNKGELGKTIKKILSPGKGILAADESVETIGRRFIAVGEKNTEPNRELYREMLFTTPKISDYISGVILFKETLYEKTSGDFLRDVLKKKKIVLGAKVDTGLSAFNFSKNEYITKGIEGLHDRLSEFYSLGVRFAKWRAAFSIGEGLPTDRCIEKNGELFATYARECQKAGIVPIIEPEVLSNGSHSLLECFDATRKVQEAIYRILKEAKIDLSTTLLKPNMIVPGLDSNQKVTPEEVANKTVSCLKATVPKEVPGIVFLSGGLSEREACQYLNAIASHRNLPWVVTYSFGRALQNSAMQEWGVWHRIKKAQTAFLHRAKLTSLSQRGKYSEKLEKKLSE